MHPPHAHGFPRLVRKKADWGDWVVSPVWIVMESATKRTLNGAVVVSPICCVPNLLPICLASMGVAVSPCLFLHAT
jgi:hypothetical protein